MNTSSPTPVEHVSRTATGRKTRDLGARADLVFWALLYGLATMVAADVVISDLAAQNFADSPFGSEATFLTFLRVASLGWALIFSFLQAVIYSYLFAVVAHAPRPRALRAWSWVLLSQIPFIALVGAVYMVNGAEGLGVLQDPWARITLGLVSVVIFAVLAARATRASMGRVGAFVVLAFTVNTALLLLTAVG